MKKLTSLGVLALVGLLALLGFSPAAQAYPDVRIDLTVDRQIIYGGETFTATATANVNCAWNLEWDGRVRTSSGTEFVTTFRADDVSKVTKIPLHGTCQYAAPAARSERSARAAATWERTLVITVLPPSTAVSPPAAGSDLPNTGGPDFLFLIGGLALLVAGATAVTVARRRAEEAEIAASRA